MEWSHINNECNDRRDNNLEPLREGHSSLSLTKDVTKLIQRKKISKSSHMNSHQQTCSIKWLSNINIHDQWWRILCTYTHMLIFLFFSFLFLFFFTYIYKCTHLEHKQMSPKKDKINNGWTCSQVPKCYKLSPMRWPSQTKGLRINVRGIDNGNDMTVFHIMNWGGSPLKVEKRWSRISSKWDKRKEMKNTTNKIWWNTVVWW